MRSFRTRLLNTIAISTIAQTQYGREAALQANDGDHPSQKDESQLLAEVGKLQILS